MAYRGKCFIHNVYHNGVLETIDIMHYMTYKTPFEVQLQLICYKMLHCVRTYIIISFSGNTFCLVFIFNVRSVYII